MSSGVFAEKSSSVRADGGGTVEQAGSDRVVIALLAAAVGWALIVLQWGEFLNWDEVEFFRATRWTAEGRVPFRDYWEHHLPLQWLLFAPVAALFSDGPGAQSIIALRWAQIPLWAASFVMLNALMHRAGIIARGRSTALLLLLSSMWFVRAAVQYRVDVVGHCAYIGALWLVMRRQSAYVWFGAGVSFALGVLANMRLAPLVIATVALLLFWRPDEERWRWNGKALYAVAGGLLVAVGFILYLAWASASASFIEGVIWYNRMSDQLLPDEARSFFVRLAAPLVQRDIGGVAFLAAGAAGVVMALRRVSRPGVLQFLSVLAVLSLVMVATLGVQYEYHFQTSALLLLPAGAAAIGRLQHRHRAAVSALAAANLLLGAISMAPDFGIALKYQDRVMKEVDRLVPPGDRVWDSVGYAIRREPAYRYWFLPAGIRLLSDRGMVEPYDFDQITADPPAAIVYSDRTRWWMSGRPRLAHYVTHHYIPLDQHLWIPGMSGVVGPKPTRLLWTVPRTGRYDLYVSELLVKHPWFARPAQYGLLQGPEFLIPLDRLPPAPLEAFQWRVNGVPVDARSPITLSRGAQLEIRSVFRGRAGVLAVPHGVTALSRMPDTGVRF